MSFTSFSLPFVSYSLYHTPPLFLELHLNLTFLLSCFRRHALQAPRPMFFATCIFAAARSNEGVSHRAHLFVLTHMLVIPHIPFADPPFPAVLERRQIFPSLFVCSSLVALLFLLSEACPLGLLHSSICRGRSYATPLVYARFVNTSRDSHLPISSFLHGTALTATGSAMRKWLYLERHSGTTIPSQH